MNRLSLDFFIKILIFVFSLYLFNNCEHKSGRRVNQGSRNPITFDNTIKRDTVKMEYKNGVRYIPVEINGVGLRFIFDTGASDISISSLEAKVLIKQGTLSKDDILGEAYYKIASGETIEAIKINLREVKIGNRVLNNIEASIIKNQEADLLLGQSALEKFGKITIDNKNNVIIFE